MRMFDRSKRELPCPPQHFPGPLLERLFRGDDFDYAFIIVRNPVYRMFSEYRYRRKLEGVTDGFSEWLDSALEGFKKDPYHLQNHMRPQVEFRALRLSSIQAGRGSRGGLRGDW